MSSKEFVQSCLDIIAAESGEPNAKAEWERVLEEQGLGEIKDYVRNECKERGNIEVSYVETINSADVFSIV